MAFAIGLLFALSTALITLGAFSSKLSLGIGVLVLILAIVSARRADKRPDLIPPG